MNRLTTIALGALGAVGLVAGACGSSSPSAPSAAASKAEITSVYDKLFDFADKSIPAKVAAVQDGASLQTAIDQGMSSPLASGVAGASVSSVTLLSNSACTAKDVPTPCASVGYSLLSTSGSAVLSGETGYATYASGKWLVAKVTICGLLDSLYSVEGKTGVPPGCPSAS